MGTTELERVSDLGPQNWLLRAFFTLLLFLLLPLLLLRALPLLPPATLLAASAGAAGAAIVDPAYLVRGERAFCAPLRDYGSADPAKSILFFLHPGAPPFWVSTPVPDHVKLGEKALAAGGLLPTGYGYDGVQRYVEGAARDAIILDVGGHFGFFGLSIAATGRSVVAFEPVPSSQRLHQLGVCRNGFFDRYTLVRGAVGEEDGNLTLHVPAGSWTDNAALAKSASTALVGGASVPIGVRVFTLDAFAAAHLSKTQVARICLVKVDVQGQEAAVFRGGKGLFSQLTPGTWVIAEHVPELVSASGFAPLEDVKAIVALGYTVHGEHGGPEIGAEKWGQVPFDLWYRKT
jgi:FkbM family methyltransferase